jgi:hypothetical protein
MQDLSFITEDQSAEVELTSPVDDAKLGAFFTFAGPEHPIRKQRALARTRKVRKAYEKTQRLELGDPEDDEEKLVSDMVAATLGWRCSDGPYIVINGEQIVYSAETCRRLYTDAKLAWIRRWALGKLENVDVFIKASSPSSASTPAGTSN